MDDQALRDYFKFDQVDLNANRIGKLSEKQLKTLVKNEKNYKKDGVRYGLIVLVIASIFPFVFIPQAVAAWQKQNMGGVIGALIPVFIWVLIWGGLGFGLIYDGLRDRSKIVLKKVQGPINLVAVESSGSHGHTYINHELHIGEEEFEVDEDLAGIIMQGDVLAIYFIDESQKILSVERLGSAAPSNVKYVARVVPAPADPNVAVAQGNYCSNCGSPNATGARFCNKCGKPLPV